MPITTNIVSLNLAHGDVYLTSVGCKMDKGDNSLIWILLNISKVNSCITFRIKLTDINLTTQTFTY